MAEPTLAEFEQMLGGGQPAQEPAPLEPITLVPATQAALDKSTKALESSRFVVSKPDKGDTDSLLKLGARPGVPFDAESGISFMQRLRNSFQPTKEDEIKALESAYGKGSVRQNAFGWLIVTKPGRDGKPTDTLVDPVGGDIGDLAAALTELPAMVGGGLALKGAKFAPGILNAAKNLARVTGGALAGRAVSDTVTRGLEGEPVQPGEIAARRGTEAVLDLGFGTVMGVGGKVASQLITPMGGQGPLQAVGLAARDRLGKQTGIYLEMTPAEMTGSQFLMRAEAMEMNKPGASAAFEEIFRTKQRQIAEIQDTILGGAVPDEELAGQRAMAALGSKTAPLEQNVQRAAAATGQAATAELKGAIGGPVDKTALGAGIRQRATELREEFQTQADTLYNEVFADPLTQSKNIPGTPLAKEADTLIAELPTIEKRVSEVGFDTYGSPIEVSKTKQEVLKEFVPEKLLPKLRALQDSRGQQFRLDELMAMRREVDNDIALGESIPGVQTRYLSKVRGMLTQRIKTGLDELSPALRVKWEKANDFYAKEVSKFKRAGITELFKDPEQAGYLGETAIVDRVTSGGTKAQDTYRAYREFFGANSPEVKGVQQAIRDDVFGLDRIEGQVDAKGFISRLTALAKDAPDAFDDAFGSSAAGLRNAARALRVSRGDTLPEEELMSALGSGNLSAQKLQDMLSAEATKTQAYRNELVRAIGEGNLKPDTLKPTELVNRLVFKKDTQPTDLQGLLGYISDRPDILEDVRRLTFKKVLDDATILHKTTGTKVLSGDALEETLNDPNMRKRLEITMGNGTLQSLSDLKDVLKLGSSVQTAAKTAGGMQTGAQIAGLVETGALKYVDRAIKNFVIASIYTTPKAKAYFANTRLSRQGKSDLVNALVVSAPFVLDLIETFGEGRARKAAQQIGQSVQRASQEGGEPLGTQPAPEPSVEEFEQMLK
jgi:hypothetical protein